MSEVTISQVRLDSNGRVRLRTTGASIYPYIYRDASSVRWDEATGELYTLEIPGFDALAQFNQIAAAVRREYGDDLVFSPATEYLGIPVELAAALRESTG